jgi:hypothetical protein
VGESVAIDSSGVWKVEWTNLDEDATAAGRLRAAVVHHRLSETRRAAFFCNNRPLRSIVVRVVVCLPMAIDP